MKPVLLLMLIFALLLSACGNTESGLSTELPSGTAAETLTQTDAPGTEPTVPATEPPVETAFFSGSVTAGGFRVRTDVSAYAPSAGSARYTRLREGPLSSFEPSADYGAVYPYQAARLFGSAENGEAWEQGGFYGFVDGNGRILTDGIYTRIRVMSCFDYVTETTRFLPFWITGRVREPIVRRDPEYPEYEWVEGKSLQGVVSCDGSFCLPCEYVGITPLPNCFVCYRSWDETDFEVYDFEGRLRLTGSELVDEGSDGWDLENGGEYPLLLSLYREDGSCRCWFCDLDGKRVLGPYSSAEPFSEGLACVSTDETHYGYIDSTGAWVLPADYTADSSFVNGRALQRLEDDTSIIIDRAGLVLLRSKANSWFYPSPCGFREDNTDDYSVTFYDRDGKELAHGGYGMECLDADTFLEQSEEQSHIFRLNGESIRFGRVDGVVPCVAVIDGEPLAGYRCMSYTDEGIETRFVRQDLSEVLQLEQEPPAEGGYFILYDTADERTNETWYLTWDGGAWNAVNDAGELIRVPLRCGSLTFRGERIMALTDTACVYLDRAGKQVFSWPLDAED